MPVLEAMQEGGIILYLALFVFFGPFVLALMLSGRGHSFMFMLKSFISYQLFLPMLVSWFGAYSFARVWDLSWGNRPSSELNDVTEEQRNFMVTKFKEKNMKIIIGLLIVNLLVFFIPLQGQFVIMGLFLGIASYQMFFSTIFCLIKIFYKIR